MSSKTKKTIKIVLWSICGAILLFVFIVLGTLLVEKYIKKSPVPMFAGYAYLIVDSDSMSPTINKGDLIVVKTPEKLKIGKIVTFMGSDGKLVTHRIVRYADDDKTLFVTRGDFNMIDDTDVDMGPFTADQILAEHVLTIPKVGLFFEWFIQDNGFIYAIAIIAVIVAGVYFFGLTKEPEAQKETSSETPNADSPEDNAQKDTTDNENNENSKKSKKQKKDKKE